MASNGRQSRSYGAVDSLGQAAAGDALGRRAGGEGKEQRSHASHVNPSPRRHESILVTLGLFGTALAVLALIFSATRNAHAPAPAPAKIFAAEPQLDALATLVGVGASSKAGGKQGLTSGAVLEQEHQAWQAVPNAEVGATGTITTQALPGKAAREAAAAKASSAAKPKARERKIGGEQPNIIFILVDDMGTNDIGYQSTDLYEMTPNLDALAAKGVKLSNYYSSYLCTPARSTLLTGRNPYRYGLQYSVILPAAPFGLRLQEKLLPEYLNDAGYKSHMMGKWHLGSHSENYLPHRRGFETFLGYLNDEEDYYTHQGLTMQVRGRSFRDFGYAERDAGFIDPRSGVPFGAKASAGHYSTDIFTQRAVDVARDHTERTPDEPLFIYLSYQAVHDPLGPPPDSGITDNDEVLLDRIPSSDAMRSRFARVLLYMDRQVGWLMSSLEDLGYMDNTLIIVASDNGGCPEYGGSNYPLRGIKHSYWEGGSKVPAFVYGPGVLPEEISGTTFDGIFSVADWVPTLAHIARADLVEGVRYDGVNQWEALTYGKGYGERKEAPVVREHLVYNYDMYQQSSDSSENLLEVPPKGAIRSGKWKLIIQEWCVGWHSFNPNDSYPTEACADLGACWLCGTTCVNKVDYKPASYLFNLEEDPEEHHNLIDLHPRIARKLHEQWMADALAEHEPTHHMIQMVDVAERIWKHHDDCMVPWWEIFNDHNETSGPDTGGNHSYPSGGDPSTHILPGASESPEKEATDTPAPAVGPPPPPPPPPPQQQQQPDQGPDQGPAGGDGGGGGTDQQPAAGGGGTYVNDQWVNATWRDGMWWYDGKWLDGTLWRSDVPDAAPPSIASGSSSTPLAVLDWDEYELVEGQEGASAAPEKGEAEGSIVARLFGITSGEEEDESADESADADSDGDDADAAEEAYVGQFHAESAGIAPELPREELSQEAAAAGAEMDAFERAVEARQAAAAVASAAVAAAAAAAEPKVPS